MASVVVFVFVLLFPSMCKFRDAKCTVRKCLSGLHKYFQEGDLIIGAMSSFIVPVSDAMNFKEPFNSMAFDKPFVRTSHYQHVLALAFAVKEINENLRLLPNVTLGFHIRDSYLNERETYHAIMQLFSIYNRFIPNYKCDFQSNLIAVVGGAEAKTSLYIATMLSIYNIPQLSYGSTSLMNETFSGLSTYQMVPNEAQQYKGILQLILHFHWTWIGLIVVDDERGERFQQVMGPLFSQNGICLAFIEKILQGDSIDYYFDMMKDAWKDYDTLMESKANVVVLFGDTASVSYLRCSVQLAKQVYTSAKPKGKVYIMTIQMDFTSFYYQRDWDNIILHGAISLMIHTREPPGFHQFLQSIKPLAIQEDGFLREFWEQAFLCNFNDSLQDKTFHATCTGEEKMESLPGDVFDMSMTGTSYSIYSAVYAVAHALHDLYSSPYGHSRMLKIKKYNFFSQSSCWVTILGKNKTLYLATKLL